MVNRKQIEFLFLFLAGLIVFAHAIIPHHHHCNQVCIEKLDCQHHDTNPNHPVDDDHSHNDINHRYCLLGQLIAIPNNQWKQECTCSASSGMKVLNFAVLNTGSAPAAIYAHDATGKPAPKDSQYSLQLSGSLSLRAPPAV